MPYFPHIQTATGVQNSSTSTAATAAFAANVTTGNLIVVAVATFSTNSPTVSLSDGVNTYTQIGTYKTLVGTGILSLWYAIAATTATLTITETPSVATFQYIVACEYSSIPASPLDGSSSNSSASSNSPTTGSITVSNNNELLVAWSVITGTQNTATITGGAGYNERVTFNGQGIGYLHYHDTIVSATTNAGPYKSTVTGTFVAFGASFKTSLSSGGTPMVGGSPLIRMRGAA